MKLFFNGANWGALLTVCALFGLSLPAQANGQAGPWCVGALQALDPPQDSAAGIASQLLALQTIPAIPESPRRLVFVSSRAAGPGDGSRARPLRKLQVAVNRARPGDKIIVLPGDYDPVRITASGTAEAPIIVAAENNASGRVVIDGTGKKDKSGKNVRGLIEIRGASYVTVSGFRLQNAPRDGVFVEGTTEGERGIRILDNDIDTTGNSAIFVAGIVMRFITKVEEYRLFDVLVQGNRITRTNEPKGVNEAISLGGGVDGFVIRNNYIFDTRQYGIDAKAGAINGSITDNVIHGIVRHGIYLDTGSRTVAHIDVRRNAVFGAKNGIVMARESDRDPEHPNLHNIQVEDNLIFDIAEFGIKAYRHPDDSGIGRFGEVTIAANCVCGIRRDAIRLGGIGDFAKAFEVRDNLILSSGGEVWNRIGADVGNNGASRGDLNCPA